MNLKHHQCKTNNHIMQRHVRHVIYASNSSNCSSPCMLFPSQHLSVRSALLAWCQMNTHTHPLSLLFLTACFQEWVKSNSQHPAENITTICYYNTSELSIKARACGRQRPFHWAQFQEVLHWGLDKCRKTMRSINLPKSQQQTPSQTVNTVVTTFPLSSTVGILLRWTHCV